MANYHPEDVIRLARANPGFGFREFLKELHGKKQDLGSGRESQILRLFEIHKHETGEDLFEILQDPSKIVMLTRDEWKKVTNNSPTPRGAGLSSSRTPSPERKMGLGTNARNIPMPPQIFDWLDVNEVPDEKFVSGAGSTSHTMLLDYQLIIRLNDVDMLTERQISERTGYSGAAVSQFLKNLVKYDQMGVADDWVRVLTFLWNVQLERGVNHLSDEIMMDMRGIFRDYVKDPVNVESPTDEDLVWVYSQLLSEEE